MSEGIQKRVQPDLIQEIEQYSGGSFSEKMVKWKNDVDTLLDFDFEDIENKIEAESDRVIRQLGGKP